jgi:hypothetical protein
VSAAPRTLAVLHLAEPGGPSIDLGAHLGWIAEAGRLDVLVPGPGHAAAGFGTMARVREAPYAALTTPRSSAEMAHLAARLRREARMFRGRIRAVAPDVMVVATTTLPAALLAARLERVPAVTYAAELLTGQASGRIGSEAAAGRALLSLNQRLSAGIVACSETVAAQLAPGPDVATVCPPIADAYGDGDGERFRAEHGIGPQDPCVVTVGNVSRGRGQDVAVRALARVRRSVPEARLAIVGEPFPRAADLEFRVELDRVAADAGVGEAVSFCGFVDRIADAYAAADVVVNPTRFPEAFGRAACEALVAGRPVVSSAVGATPGVLRGGRTAVLVPPGDESGLADAVVSLLRDPDRAASIAAAGRADVLQRFDPERARAAFAGAIERVALRSG